MTNVTRRDFLGTALLAPRAMRAAAAGRPNFLYLLPDQFRFDWLSGNPSLPVRTPNLDALARRGVRFTKAAVPAPLCAPSRACLAAGCEYDECGVASNAENFSLSRPPTTASCTIPATIPPHAASWTCPKRTTIRGSTAASTRRSGASRT